MKTLFQLKNRIAWEIQTLRDRQARITEIRDFRGTIGQAGDEVDRALAAEFATIDERIEAFEHLDKARRTLKILRRKLAIADGKFRQMIRDEIWKVTSAVGQVRASVGV